MKRIVVTVSPEMLDYDLKPDSCGFGLRVIERDTGREVNFIWNWELEDASEACPLELRPERS